MRPIARLAAALALSSLPLAGCVGANGLPILPGITGGLTSGFSININANPSSVNVAAGSDVSLSCSVNNPAGTPVSFSWSASGGSLSNATGPSTTWTAPGSPGSYTISVTASNGTDDAPGQVRFTVQ